MKKQITLREAAELFRIDQVVVVEMIEYEWIQPMKEHFLDEEDVARIQLILDLRHRLGANDEAIPVILHLTDQLYFLRNQLDSLTKSNS